MNKPLSLEPFHYAESNVKTLTYGLEAISSFYVVQSKKVTKVVSRSLSVSVIQTLSFRLFLLQDHKKEAHLIEEKFYCECGKPYATKESIAKHRRSCQVRKGLFTLYVCADIWVKYGW